MFVEGGYGRFQEKEDFENLEMSIRKMIEVTCWIIDPWHEDNSFKRFSAASFLSISTTKEFLLRCLSLIRSPFARARS